MHACTGHCSLPASYEFTEFYRKVYQSNTDNADSIFQKEVKRRLDEHSGCDNDVHSYNINMYCIMSHIGRLKYNKSAGLDGIVNEHIIFGGNYLTIHTGWAKKTGLFFDSL